ncbi:amidase [Dongia mobilis]|uniref:Amidase n=1 Tax=Dongia mobilis TaxID=578943 RepID=A0A4R6WPT7_9PROT|nr:amidase family protein [Dongia mobilis]TDQ83204.1 amidase [Dongia mobilis]
MTGLWRLTAVAAVEKLKKGEVTPLDLIDDALARIAAVGPRVNAVVTLCPDRARDHAKRLMALPVEQRGPLAGLPIGVKELNDVAGVRVTYGSPIFADNVPEKSDIMVERIEANGGIVLGMTNTPEFGAGANTFNEVHGETLNPWNTKLNAGGSSGGAAVALATGQVWLATGSDLGGSLRTPAAFCSVVGLRPSPGRVAAGPGELRFDTLAVDGPMARNIEDTALFLDAMAGDHVGIPISYPKPAESFLAAARRREKPARVALCLDPAGLPIEPEVQAMIRAAADKLAAAGIAIEEAAPDFGGVGEAFQTLRAVDYAATMRPLLNQHRDKLKQEVIWNAEKGLALTGEQIGKALIRRSRLYADMVRFFGSYDLLLLPAAPILPRHIKERWPREINGETLDNYVEWLKLAALITMTACPALSLPCGFSADGRPMGLQLVGRPKDEGRLLSHALLCEEILGLRNLVPMDPRS